MVAEACIGHDRSMPLPADLDQLDADALRRLLIEQERELVWRQTKIERLTHELALHKRHRFSVKAERLVCLPSRRSSSRKRSRPTWRR